MKSKDSRRDAPMRRAELLVGLCLVGALALILTARFAVTGPSAQASEAHGEGQVVHAEDASADTQLAALESHVRLDSAAFQGDTTAGEASFETGRAPSGSIGPRPLRIDRELAAGADARIRAALKDALARGKGTIASHDLAVAARVIDRATGAVIYERDAQSLYAPASNLKLVTTLSALVLLPPDWRFTTVLAAVEPPVEGTLRGPLVVRAGGDPLYHHDRPAEAEARLAELAKGLAARGLRAIEGGLCFDMGDFADEAPAEGWPKPQGDFTASYALVSGLSLHGGLLSLAVHPGAVGQRATVQVLPRPTGLSESFRVETVASGRPDVRVGVVDGRRSLSITGTLAARQPVFRSEFRHPAPREHFAACLRAALEAAGIEVRGASEFVRHKVAPHELARLETPWIDLLPPINRHSVNGVADSLFLALGAAQGGSPTRENARAAIAGALERLGVDTKGLVTIDGSGLSRNNRVTAEQLSELLMAGLGQGPMQSALFLASLAHGGEDGTLDGRMGKGVTAGRVRAKTGFIRGASALSGLATTVEGRELVFSILVRYPPLDGYNDACWKPMQDDLVTSFVEWTPGENFAAPHEAAAAPDGAQEGVRAP